MSVPARSFPARPAPWLHALPVLLGLLLGAGCSPQEAPPSTGPVAPRVASSSGVFHGQPIGAALQDRPWIAHVLAVDLDQDGHTDVLACEAQTGEILWLRNNGSGELTERVIASGLHGPVHVEAADMDRDGDLDLLVSCMGQVFPSNERIGSVVLFENKGRDEFTPRVLLKNVARVNDARAADFDGDGRMDIVVAQFGYLQGEIRMLRQRADGSFASEIQLDLPGTVNVCVADYDGDGHPDFAALVSQQYEEIVLFTNDGSGRFARRTIFGSTNEDFGSSGLVMCDLNRDGRPDLLYTNGDGFDYAEPGPRPWHGVHWLENVGGGKFVTHRIGDQPGAFAPVAADFDGDGDLDVVVVSGFNDWSDPQAVSLAYFENDGQMNFRLRVGATRPTHLLTTAVADLDGSGRPVLITGGFHAYPPWDRLSRLMTWRLAVP